MAADNEAPAASSANESRPSGDNNKASSNNGSKNRRNPRHDHRKPGKGRSEKGRGEWGREKGDKRKKNDEFKEFKRRKLNKKGDSADGESSNNPFSKDEIAAEERRPKRKVAVMIGYAGTGYKGMQVNGNEKTIEADLFKAFVAASAISKANADDPKKSSLVRCARTDKGVHAAGNVISLKLIIEDEDIVDKINAELPEQIRIWGIQRTNNAFSCYQTCDSRWYEYLMPSYCLLPPHPESFLGQKLVELAKEHGVEDELAARMEDVKDFWSDVEEKEIKPILARLDPETKAAVLERVHVMDDEEVAARKEAAKETEESAPAEEKPAAETPAGEAAEQTTEPEAQQPGLVLESHKPKNRELGPVDFALRDIKAAYVAAKRRYRVSTERLNRLQEALNKYNGTKNFHNYTVQKSFFDPSAKRHIKSFVVNPKPIIINDTEWLSLKVHGQSFMMHQIRKMVGLASLIVRCGTPMERINESYQNQKMAIPKAPGLGLLLERPVFHNYNRKATESLGKEAIDFDKYEEKIQAFKDKQIYTRIFSVEEKDNSFHMFFNQIDQFKTNHFLWLTAGGMKAAEIARDTTGEKVQQDVDKQLGDEDEEDPEGGEVHETRDAVDFLKLPTIKNSKRPAQHHQLRRRQSHVVEPAVKMSAQALNKIAPNSPSRQNPSELETSIAQALFDLESNTSDLKVALRPLQIVSAREIEVGHGKKAIVIFVPVPSLQGFHRVQQRLTRELEKKFSDRHVLILASRRILPRPKRSARSRNTQKQKRPRSRTLTAVHDAILEDLTYPVEIVGKRVRTKEDGSKLLKVILDEKERGGVDYRLDTYSEVYRRLTGRNVNFEFPQSGPADY
ncbi:ribosomal protein S7e-domain-containing protein [Fusarium oxysporum f. sp. albedinis]|nr:ribosomal protein S7e-domain-containing protein [Fusarium oxysporum f. sp. albedinis]